LHAICSRGGTLYFEEQRDPSPIIRLLIGAGSSELLILDNACLQNYRGPEGSFSVLLQQCFPPLDQWSLRDRLSVALALGDTWWPNSGNLIRMVLKPAKLEETALAREPDNPALFNHCVARYMMRPGRREEYLHRYETPNDPWRTLTRELITAGKDPCWDHCWDHWSGRSILGALMDGGWGRPRDVGKVLVAWLQDLKDAGMDLEEYGKRESALSQALNEKSWIDEDQMFGSPMGFTSYGPAVENWMFYPLEPTYRFAGIFWKLVEKQTRVGEDSGAELDYSGTNSPDSSDASETEVELSEMKIPGSWATFDDEND
jgi:hypothetical protein